MPRGAITLLPGVNTNRTPAMNQASIVNCDMIRFMSDSRGGCLVQKLGGWTKFFPSAITSIIRSLRAFESILGDAILAVGAEKELSVIKSGVKTVLTPQELVSNSSINFSTQAGNPQTEIIDSNGTVVTEFDSVYIATPVSVGGVVFFGSYSIIPSRDIPYFVNYLDALGNITPVPQTVVSGGVVPNFSTVTGSSFVTVNFPNHGFFPGDPATFLVPTNVGGLTIYGAFIVNSVSSPDIYTIIVNGTATSTQNNYAMNADPLTPTIGRVQFIYNLNDTPVSSLGGYGFGLYGAGGYGVGSFLPPSTGTPITCTDWSLDNFGAILIASPVNDTPIDQFHQTGGPIYYWDPSNPQVKPQVIIEAPFFCDSCFVAMPQQQIIALACEFDGIQDPLLIRWSDIADFTVWIPEITNQAGDIRISEGSRIVGGTQGPHQIIIWTDIAAWSMQYVGRTDQVSNIYQTNKIADGCGLIGRKAFCSMNGVVYWLSQGRCMMLGDSGIQEIPCPIWDVIFQEIDFTHANNIRLGANSNFGEIFYYFPTLGSNGVITRYAKFTVALNEWDFGTMPRTAWINQSIFGPPIGGYSTPGFPAINYIYQHETSNDADGLPLVSFFTTGFFALSEGEQKVFLDQFWPDMKWGKNLTPQTAKVNITFNYTDSPGKPVYQTKKFVINQQIAQITTRVRTRLLSMTVQSDDLGSFWRIGQNRYQYSQDGEY